MPASTRLKLRGKEQLQRNLHRLAKNFTDAIGPALTKQGEQVMTKSKRDHVPVDLGALRTSGHVVKAEWQGREVVVRLVYGGTPAPYALAVHEHVQGGSSKYDPPSWEGKVVNFGPGDRGPEYLAKPLKEKMKTLEKDLATELLAQDILGGII